MAAPEVNPLSGLTDAAKATVELDRKNSNFVGAVKAAGDSLKTFRFGLLERYADKSNQERLEEEVGDLMCMIELMQDNGIIDPEFVRAAALTKRSKLSKWSSIFNEEIA